MRPSEIEVCKARLIHARQPLADIAGATRAALAPLAGMIRPGARIALAVGSRGVANIDVIARAAVLAIRNAGGEPFIVPAMGSHGGATAEGQARVLRDYGIDEITMGAPVLSSMEVVPLGTTGGSPDIPVWLDKHAAGADGILAINRVKAHTDFHGTHESGIVKMMAIGLGKQAQAVALHRYGAEGLRDNFPRVARAVIERGKVLGALAVLEDGYDQTADVAFAPGLEVFALDRAFLGRSRAMMARLPFDALDALVVDRMGKNISGTGMDTNVIGRLRIAGQPDGEPVCGRIAVLDLTPESHGNALGVGLADITTARLRDRIDWGATNENVITSGFLERGFLPVVAATDEEAVRLAVSGGNATPETIRMACIRDTLHLDEIYLTRALLAEADPARCEPLTGFVPMAFGADGAIGVF